MIRNMFKYLGGNSIHFIIDFLKNGEPLITELDQYLPAIIGIQLTINDSLFIERI